MSLIDSIVGFKAAQTTAEIQMAMAAKILKITQGQGQAAADMVAAANENLEKAMSEMLEGMGSGYDRYA
ncbi:MAG: hypothetical protein KA354_03950 [Phycisphaerae bacterium]|nr:hypothetical protein [Phycisphaerae bacterium]